jgi:hypothetical protein
MKSEVCSETTGAITQKDVNLMFCSFKLQILKQAMMSKQKKSEEEEEDFEILMFHPLCPPHVLDYYPAL